MERSTLLRMNAANRSQWPAFAILPGGGKGPRRKFTHPDLPGAVTLSGQDDDAKHYQERQVKRAIEEANG